VVVGGCAVCLKKQLLAFAQPEMAAAGGAGLM